MSDKKESKQVISGFHRPVCFRCCREMYPKRNGVGVLDIVDGKPYELYDADLWSCAGCGIDVVGGFGPTFISAHYDKDFETHIKHYKDLNLLIENHC